MEMGKGILSYEGIQWRRRHSTAFNEESSDFGNSSFGVIVKSLRQRIFGKECSGGPDADPLAFTNDLHGDMACQICGARGGKEIYSLGTHPIKDYTPSHRRDIQGSVNYLSPFFINYYQRMGLVIVAEQKRFPLETETTDDEEALGANEVASEEDDIALALSLVNVDKSEDVIKERLQKRRKLQLVTTSEIIDQRAESRVQRLIPTKRRSKNVHARSKMKARRPRIVKKDNTQCSETASQYRISSEE
ncbi:hypothetical protein AXG93_2836s1000 [Marchantia polymorpha subsp. ruderalis]|uniref:Uncharacterized protein n=1 Tax=Marchantia polymorpha subsp. ruderalis TaxID=1480154 RepID=A0A176VT26_MARPO|nr:hypothetical protein AXG93_2836s1000 [Marchantia polymorpha subsp. ruderalis]